VEEIRTEPRWRVVHSRVPVRLFVLSQGPVEPMPRAKRVRVSSPQKSSRSWSQSRLLVRTRKPCPTPIWKWAGALQETAGPSRANANGDGGGEHGGDRRDVTKADACARARSLCVDLTSRKATSLRQIYSPDLLGGNASR